MVGGLGGLEVPLLLVGESLGDQYEDKTTTEAEIDRIPGGSDICRKLRDEEDCVGGDGDEVKEDLVKDIKGEAFPKGGCVYQDITFWKNEMKNTLNTKNAGWGIFALMTFQR